MIGQQDVSAATQELRQSERKARQLPDPAICRTDQFVDREVPITRCLTPGNCPHRRAYLGIRICGYPNITAKLAGAAITALSGVLTRRNR